MLSIALCLLVQPESNLSAKLDMLYAKEVETLKRQIESAQKNRKNNQQQLRAKLATLQKDYNVTVPTFDFSEGVREGDLGTIGLYKDDRVGQRIPTGNGGTVFVPSGNLTSRQARIRKQEDNHVEVKLMPSFAGEDTALLIGIPSELLIEDKVISLGKYIFEYKGKHPKTRFRIYEIVGTEADLNKWRKAKVAKK